MKAITITKENFKEEVLDSTIPVVADFWAAWCGYCTRLAPALEELAEEFDGKIKLAKINVDEQPELTSQFGVDVFPTLILFQSGNAKDKAIGAVPKEQLRTWLEQNIR